MKGPYAVFKTNPRTETDGLTLDYGGFRIRIARAGGSNVRFTRNLRAKLAPYRRHIELGTLDEATSSRIMREAYVDNIVLGWEGVSDAEGNPIPFSRENALKLFEDLPDLFADVYERANDWANFRDAEAAEDEKNSSMRSVGN